MFLLYFLNTPSLTTFNSVLPLLFQATTALSSSCIPYNKFPALIPVSLYSFFLTLAFLSFNVNELFIQDKYIQKISCSASPCSEILIWATELVLFYMENKLFSILKNQKQWWWHHLLKTTAFFPKLVRLFYPFSDLPCAAWLLQMLLSPQCVSAALVISAQHNLQEAWGKALKCID